MKPLLRLTSSIVTVPQANIDTDQIVPARFLTTTSMEGLGHTAFHDWRFDEDGNERDGCVFNEPIAKTSEILVAGENFGCGSSREHAPQALADFGFRVVVSSRIADIFRQNAPRCGLLPVVLDETEASWLLQHPETVVTVDLREGFVEFEGHRARFEIEPFARHCLMNGVDPLGFLLEQEAHIKAYEERAA
ncbi:MAG: 3-isopropylmalate dehydratase small subunit [Pseudomonadota bacterium]